MPASLTLVEPPQGGSPTLPHNVEAEAALLGALMIDNRIIEDIQLKLRADHFFEPLHGRIFEQIRRPGGQEHARHARHPPPGVRGGRGDEAARRPLLSGPAHRQRPRRSSVRATSPARSTISRSCAPWSASAARWSERALDTSEEVEPKKQIEEAEAALLPRGGGGRHGRRGEELRLGRARSDQDGRQGLSSGGGLSGLTTGINAINAKTGGLHNSDLLILAGRPGMGKTSLATNIAFNTSRKYVQELAEGVPADKMSGTPVAFFSLEMSADQLATRILAEQSEVSSEALRMGKISREEFRNLARASTELQDLPLYIDDTPGLTIAALRTRARRLKRQRQIGLIVVDYLQLLQGTGKSGGDQNRVQEISEISRGLKTLAKELQLPVIALSQLSRQVESREDKRPQLSDLRESGSIEQDADIVMFVYREDYYLAAKEPREGSESGKGQESYEEWQRQMQEVYGQAELIVAKQRHGATGKVKLRFDARITRFSDLADTSYLPEPRG
jgi:replicative DNA helicase